MNRLFRKLVLLPAGIWKGMGADIAQLDAILQVKLMKDDRKPLTFGRRQQKKNSRFNSVLSMVIYFFMGLIYVLPLVAFPDTIFALWAYFTTFLFILTFSLLTDFANVVIDTNDKYIILPRPVNDRTLFLSRLLYVFIYLVRIVLPMSLSGWIVIGLDFGWKAAAIFPLPLLMMVFIALFLVNAFYLVILRFAKPGKFKEIIGSMQIAFSIFVFAFYYLIQGVVKSAAVKNLNPLDYSWIQITPSYWLATCWSWLGYNSSFLHAKWFSLLAIVFPLVSLWATVKWLAPQFTSKLAAIDGVDLTVPILSTSKKTKHTNFHNKLANALNRNDLSKAGFILTWLQTGRSSTFKMRVYPALAYVPVYFFYILLMDDAPLTEVLQGLPETKAHLFLLYMSAFAMVQALSYVNISDQYKAAWVYYAAPIETPGAILTGAFKALWLKYFFPFIGAISLFVIYVWGVASILDILLAVVNVSVFTICIMRISHRVFPFSLMEQMKTTGGKTVIRVLFTFVLMGFMGFGHYLVSFLWWLKLLFLILSAIFFWLVWDSCKNTDWNSIKTAEI